MWSLLSRVCGGRSAGFATGLIGMTIHVLASLGMTDFQILQLGPTVRIKKYATIGFYDATLTVLALANSQEVTRNDSL
jgi:hypothetical protein